MKAISSSIIVLSGSLMVSVGSMSSWPDTQMMMSLFGGLVVVIGLVGWFSAPNEK